MPALQQPLRRWRQEVSISLLAFLLLLCVDVVWTKPLAILIAIIPLRRILLSKGILKAAPLFYYCLPLIGILTLFIHGGEPFTPRAINVLIAGGYWITCALVVLIFRAYILYAGQARVRKTIGSWCIINAFVTLLQLLRVMYLSGTINPFGSADTLYGASTGDYLRGVFFGPSYLNMMVNSALAMYYAAGRKPVYACVAMIVALSTCTNFGMIALLPLLVIAGFVTGIKKWWPVLVVQLGCVAIFYLLLSGGNLRHSFSADRGAPFSTDSVSKISSFRETAGYLRSRPLTAAFGSGPGGFSSQLALRRAHLVQSGKQSRAFALLPLYIAPDFEAAHYQMFRKVFAAPQGYHSVRYLPSSSYNQIGGEYGLAGVLAFAIGYVWYWYRRAGRARLFWLWLPLLLWFMAADYLFEYISVVPLFELLLIVSLPAGKAEVPL